MLTLYITRRAFFLQSLKKKCTKKILSVHGLGVLTVNQLLKTIMALLIPSPAICHPLRGTVDRKGLPGYGEFDNLVKYREF